MTPDNDPLATLRDIHLPDPIPWWPPAPGWWLVAALIIILVVVAILWWRSGRTRRATLSELANLEKQSTTSSTTPLQTINEITQLLRRYARYCFPNENVASLVGDEWLAFLDQHSSRGGFVTGNGTVFAIGPYQKTAAFNATELYALTRAWIKQNHPRKTLPTNPSYRRRPVSSSLTYMDSGLRQNDDSGQRR